MCGQILTVQIEGSNVDSSNASQLEKCIDQVNELLSMKAFHFSSKKNVFHNFAIYTNYVQRISICLGSNYSLVYLFIR